MDLIEIGKPLSRQLRRDVSSKIPSTELLLKDEITPYGQRSLIQRHYHSVIGSKAFNVSVTFERVIMPAKGYLAENELLFAFEEDNEQVRWAEMPE